jgi:hypothetical protein
MPTFLLARPRNGAATGSYPADQSQSAFARGASILFAVRPLRLGLLFLLPCLVSCASAPPRPVPKAPAAPHDDWARLSWEDRHSEMTFLVLPNMARLFQHHAGKDAPDMACRTCHGPDAREVAYAMPRALPALDEAHMPDERLPEVRFMRDEVTPTMADLLGIDRGHFSCFGCHPRTR